MARRSVPPALIAGGPFIGLLPLLLLLRLRLDVFLSIQGPLGELRRRKGPHCHQENGGGGGGGGWGVEDRSSPRLMFHGINGRAKEKSGGRQRRLHVSRSHQLSPVKRSNAADVVLRTNPKSDGASFIMFGLIVFFSHSFVYFCCGGNAKSTATQRRRDRGSFSSSLPGAVGSLFCLQLKTPMRLRHDASASASSEASIEAFFFS